MAKSKNKENLTVDMKDIGFILHRLVEFMKRFETERYIPDNEFRYIHQDIDMIFFPKPKVVFPPFEIDSKKKKKINKNNKK